MSKRVSLTPQQKQVLCDAAHQKVSELCAIASIALNRKVLAPELILTQRGKAAGSAVLQKNTIRLNPVLFEQNFDAFLSDVIAHELSHLLVYQEYGRTKPHGAEWKRMMQDVFMVNPLTKHTFDVSDVSHQQFDYRCDCGMVQLSLIRHNRVVSGRQQYKCLKCHTVLSRAT